MTGFDINGNGVVGESETIERGPPPVWTTSDPGDSFLAVQVVAGRALARRLSGGGARFAVVSYSGAPSRRPGARPAPSVDHAISEGAPTEDPDELEVVWARVLGRGTGGLTDFATAMRVAAGELGEPSRRSIVLFMSDSTFPTVFAPDGTMRLEDPSVEEAAAEAKLASIVFHSFLLGAPLPLPEVPNTLEAIGAATGGSYTEVVELDRLHCALADTLTR